RCPRTAGRASGSCRRPRRAPRTRFARRCCGSARTGPPGGRPSGGRHRANRSRAPRGNGIGRRLAAIAAIATVAPMEGSQTDDGFARALAIDSGSALVLGTAGSGRTELLARKAAALAGSGVAVERIILLSRTAANRGRLRDRVAELVGGSFEEVW